MNKHSLNQGHYYQNSVNLNIEILPGTPADHSRIFASRANAKKLRNFTCAKLKNDRLIHKQLVQKGAQIFMQA